MTGFAAGWLELREPHDAAARAPELLQALAAWSAGRSGLRVVDLGAGTGSAWRALSPFLPDDARWTLVEHDPALVAAGTARLPVDGRIAYRQLDLAGDLETVVGEGVDLVTASALIDLVSAAWLDRLAGLLRRHRCAAWIGLTVDGDLAFAPPLEGDAQVLAAFSADMRRDKGFGPALGADAHTALAKRLEGHGQVLSASSPWRLGQTDGPMLHAMIDGIADAAAAPRSWRERRHLSTTGLRVGHRDLLFLPRP